MFYVFDKFSSNIHKLLLRKNYKLKFIEFQSKSFIEKNKNLTLFQRVVIKNKKFEIIKNQDSSLINMLKVSNGILIRTPYSKSIKPNEKKKYLSLMISIIKNS